MSTRSRLWLLLARASLPVCIILTGFVLLPVTPAQAHGVGFHVAGGWGDSTHRQFGVTWDTSVARDHAFNYRLRVAHEEFDLKRDDWEEHLSGTLFENSFGIQVRAGQSARTWLGPQVLAAVYDEEWGAGFGVALGTNWHVAESLSLCLTAAVRWMEFPRILGDDEHETAATLGIDVLWRAPGDRPPAQ